VIGPCGHQQLYDLSRRGTGKRGGYTGKDHAKLLKEEIIPKIKYFYGKVNSDLPDDQRIRPILQQDGASIHRAKEVKEVLESRHGMNYIRNWPSYSPDLAVIENVFGDMKSQCGSQLAKVKGRSQESRAKIVKIADKWLMSRSDSYIDNHIKSLRKRLDLCRKTRGEYVHY